MFDVIKETLIAKKSSLKLVIKDYIESNLIDSDGGMYLKSDSLIKINNIT